MSSSRMRAIRLLSPALLTLVVTDVVAQAGAWRTIEFNTTQVTNPDVAVAPDGRFLIFTMLGKLFRVPVQGGEAEQLTTGPFFDDDPAISPDGRLVAFQSDRDSSAGNIFLLDLATRAITQLTREDWASSPVWAPDGQWVAFLSLDRAAWNPDDSMLRPPAAVRRVRVTGGEPETVRATAEVWTVFYAPDGRLGWTITTRDPIARRTSSRIEIREPNASVSLRRSLNGAVRSIFPSHSGRELYVVVAPSLFEPWLSWRLLSLGNDSSTERLVLTRSEDVRIAVAPNDSALYYGNMGRLWRITLPGGRRTLVPIQARVRMTIREPMPSPRWRYREPGVVAAPRTIAQPRLSPDGSRLVFRALGRLWQQPVAGRDGARRLIDDTLGGERDPAFSPDGRRLAYVRITPGRQVIQVMEISSGAVRDVGPAAACAYEYLTWSATGEIVAATGCAHRHTIIGVDPATGTQRIIAETSTWEPYPQLSRDGRTLTFQADYPDSTPGYYRLSLAAAARPELLFRLPAGAEDGMIIQTGRNWTATSIQNRVGIRLLRHDPDDRMREQRVITGADGVEFAFTPDGSAVLYVEGRRLWREPVGGGPRVEIPIRLPIATPVPPAVLLQRVRLLDFGTGGFGAETSLLLEGGRIRWMGSPQGRDLPAGTITLDAGGRYAIPGLFESHGHGGCGGQNYIAHGVTAIRDMGGRLEFQNAQADRSDMTDMAVPRCFYSGRILEGPRGRSRNEDWYFVHVTDEADARAQVRQLHAGGAQFIKLYNMVPWALQRAAADEARRLGVPVEAHGGSLEQMVKGVTLGFDLTHWGPGVYDDAFQLFVAAGTHWEPTLRGHELRFRQDPERFILGQRTNERLIDDNALRGHWEARLRSLLAAHERGVTFLPGTDGGPVGLALHWELEFYVESGIAPLEVLRLATLAAARAVGADQDLGTLEVGKVADLILLDANPLENIRNTRTIWRVIKGGWLFDPDVVAPNRSR